MWLPGHVKQLQQDATLRFALALRVQMKALLVTPDGWSYDRVVSKKQPFGGGWGVGVGREIRDGFILYFKQRSMISAGPSPIVSAIKA